ncbi:hypothetical protein GW950_01305, partial [Candidatus Wolfebacteria bacterium]|nr:hypothetical protein [Candidatus Wolfebacteria bacterium]
MFKNKGFTLIELITIMGIVAIISTVSTLTIVQTRNINLLDLTAKELVANLLDTQQKA